MFLFVGLWGLGRAQKPVAGGVGTGVGAGVGTGVGAVVAGLFLCQQFCCGGGGKLDRLLVGGCVGFWVVVEVGGFVVVVGWGCTLEG